MLPYKVIEIFTSERARWQGRPLEEAVVKHVHDLRIAARCLVTRAVDGCYESGELATARIEVLASNLPLVITILLPASELERVLPQVEAMVADGIVAVRPLDVVAYKARRQLLPPQVRVRDIMTPDPCTVSPATALDEVVRRLLSSIFSGVPVVDEAGRPLGVVTQGDLIYRGKMPMRLGLLAQSDPAKRDAALAELAARSAGEVMSAPAVTIDEDEFVRGAVDRMLAKGVKRLPVVDPDGRLTGMLSRLDIFRTVMQRAPDWAAFRSQDIRVEEASRVGDIMRRDAHAVAPQTPVEEILRLIDENDIQRVAVVDSEGLFLGLISDRDLLAAFAVDFPEGIWDQFLRLVPFSERGKKHRRLREHLRARTAADVMKREIVTVLETTPVDAAIGLMIDKGLKRLPVLDGARRFKGMISRDALMRAGFGREP
jgi:CBS domain-containing protein